MTGLKLKITSPTMLLPAVVRGHGVMPLSDAWPSVVLDWDHSCNLFYPQSMNYTLFWPIHLLRVFMLLQLVNIGHVKHGSMGLLIIFGMVHSHNSNINQSFCNKSWLKKPDVWNISHPLFQRKIIQEGNINLPCSAPLSRQCLLHWESKGCFIFTEHVKQVSIKGPAWKSICIRYFF